MKKPLLFILLSLCNLLAIARSEENIIFAFYTPFKATSGCYFPGSNEYLFHVFNQTSEDIKAIPGKIEAEAYSNSYGIWVADTKDVDGGKEVTAIGKHDWMDYKVNVPVAGVYSFKFRVLAEKSQATFDVMTVSGKILKRFKTPASEINKWITISGSVSLTAGDQTLRIYSRSENWNLNWYEVSNNSSVTSSTEHAIPGKIEAEKFDLMNGVTIENTTDAGGGSILGYIDDGDWIDYKVNVSNAGNYTFNFRVASPSTGGLIDVLANGSLVTSVNVPYTGDWQNFTTVTTSGALSAGKQTIRLLVKKGAWNINWFEVLTPVTSSPPPPIVQTQSVITFPPLPSKTVGDASFDLAATSNNAAIPIIYTSSDPAIVSVSNTSGIWKATIVAPGSAVITASQEGNSQFLPAANVSQTQLVLAKTITTTSPTTSTPTTPVTTNPTITGKIPLTAKRWYQINTLGDGMTTKTGLQQLSDGILDQTTFNGWGKMFSNYDCYYEFKELSDVEITKIRFYDGTYGTFEDQPMKLYAKTSLSAQPVLLASYGGNHHGTWLEINLPQPVKAKYLMLNVSCCFPDEMELYGSYKTGIMPLPGPQKEVRLKDQFGINSFVWDFLQDDVDINIRDTICEPKMALMHTFSQYRDYIEWQKIESSEGSFYFNPTFDGGWNYDVLYARLKQEGKDIIPCIKNVPLWFLEKYYPAGERDAENIPAPYGANLLDPASYVAQAKAAFQFAARYGSTKVSTDLLSGVVTGKVYPTASNSPVRTVKTGLGLIKYIECENERDKWWKGRKAYQTGFEYAANLSAFYDGHKNTLGPGVGVKNADPNMKVVIGGIASDRTDYIRAIIDWCKEYRGYKPDGSIDLCFDVINYHMYASDASASQGGNGTRGVAPEVSWAGVMADAFVDLARENRMEVWITETGYDVNETSPIKTISIGSKSILDVQADWILRTALNNARHGINRTFLYQTYDFNLNGWGMFVASGLLDAVTKKRKPAGDFVYQANKRFGDYYYRETLNNDPLVDRYELNGKSAYILMIPDEKNRTGTYTLDLGNAASAYIYTPRAGADSMDRKLMNTENGKLTLTVTETPLFVEVSGAILNSVSAQSTERMMTPAPEEAIKPGTSLEVYPNPASDYVNIRFKSSNTDKISLRIMDISGRVYKTMYWKNTNYINEQLGIGSLPPGMYLTELMQGNYKSVKKIQKLSR